MSSIPRGKEKAKIALPAPEAVNVPSRLPDSASCFFLLMGFPELREQLSPTGFFAFGWRSIQKCTGMRTDDYVNLKNITRESRNREERGEKRENKD